MFIWAYYDCFINNDWVSSLDTYKENTKKQTEVACMVKPWYSVQDHPSIKECIVTTVQRGGALAGAGPGSLPNGHCLGEGQSMPSWMIDTPFHWPCSACCLNTIWHYNKPDLNFDINHNSFRTPSPWISPMYISLLVECCYTNLLDISKWIKSVYVYVSTRWFSHSFKFHD